MNYRYDQPRPEYRTTPTLSTTVGLVLAAVSIVAILVCLAMGMPVFTECGVNTAC